VTIRAVRIVAERYLLASAGEVWALLAEPYHLSDWWPGYTAIRPDARGLVQGARWAVVRAADPGLLRRPNSEAAIVIVLVRPGRELAWQDPEQEYTARVRIEPDGARTRVEIALEAPWWRIALEGLRDLPRRAVGRLYDLCQTAARL
jgi:uncharacterized protein YndB with AHSA1/START domain